jgi:hypothetical protein
MFVLFPALYSCLDSPDMPEGIANMREEPTVETKTDMVFSNEKFTLTIKGKILAYGKKSDYFQQGFCWGLDSTRLVDSVYFMKAETDSFAYELPNLDGNRTYYWRAIAKNPYGVGVGKAGEYRTPSENPVVVSGEIAAFPDDGALLFSGEVLSLGKINTAFVKGFYWGLDQENLTDSILVEDANLALGEFTAILLNATGNTNYYWRAFAKNDYGMSLGAIRIYTTPPIFEAEGVFTGRQRSNFTIFSLKNTIYITCGDNNSMLFTDIWRYGENRWWNDIDNIPGNARRYSVAFMINDSLAYIGTGQGLRGSQRVSYGDFFVFNGNTRTWENTTVNTPPEMPRHEAIAFSLNNKGYVVGGSGENILLRDAWEYSIQNGEGVWKQLNDFPTPLSGGVCLFNENRVFAGFGNNRETENTLWKYDAENDQWNEFAPSPTYEDGRHAKIRAGLMIRNRIYLLDVLNIIWELDPDTKQYKQKSTLPTTFPLQNEQYMFAIDEVMYMGLGSSELFYRYYPFWDN